eukprot:3062040-Rhodomonas_salina.1
MRQYRTSHGKRIAAHPMSVPHVARHDCVAAQAGAWYLCHSQSESCFQGCKAGAVGWKGRGGR